MSIDEIIALPRGMSLSLILVDTNVNLDLVENDPIWADWPQQQLETASLQATRRINSVIYAELSIAFDDIEVLEIVLKQGEFRMESIPEALYLAGESVRQIPQAKGLKNGCITRFFIGTHAAVAEMLLLTRDTRRYANSFPTVQLIAPQLTK